MDEDLFKGQNVEEWTAREIYESTSFTALIDRLYSKITPKFSVASHLHSIEEFSKWSNEFRQNLLELYGIEEMKRQTGKIAIVKGPYSNIDKSIESFMKKRPKLSYTISHFYLKSWADTLIPVLLCRPKNIPEGAKVPAFICTHGHAMNKNDLVGLRQNVAYKGNWARDFAEMGCITITMDQWGWNERGGTRSNWFFPPKNHYNHMEAKYALNMLHFGKTLNGLRFFDVMRQVDFLSSRSDVDSKRIGAGGLSLGGTTAGFTTALDPRISLTIVAGYLCTFKASISDIAHCSCNYIPNMGNLAEMSDILSLIAPRPICFVNGQKDEIFPIHATKAAYQKIKQVYQLFNAEEDCILDVTPMGHAWRGEIAYPFIKRHFHL